MKALRALIVLGLSSLLLIGSIAGFNYAIDAQCYYRCPEVSKDKRTLNQFYQMAQRLLIYPDTEIVVLGSSRGESTPPLWIQKVTGKRTLNLSVEGAEFSTKKAFLKIAQEKNPIKTVYWFADYFDLISETQDTKIKKTPALRRYLRRETSKNSWRQQAAWFQGLIDHNTTSASLRYLKRPPPAVLGQGSSNHLDHTCDIGTFEGKETSASLATKINILYDVYTQKVLRPPQNDDVWADFEVEMRSLVQKNIKVVVVILPYHPEFLRRLKNQHPDLYKMHQVWASRIGQLEAEGVEVLNYLEGFEGDDGSPQYWDDGVHFTCFSAIKMLKLDHTK